MGWLLLATGLALTLSGAGSGYRWYGLVARPGALPAASYLAGPAGGLNIVPLSCAGFVLLLTPTGTLPSTRWRWWARVAAAAAVVFVLAAALSPQPVYPEYPDIRSPIGVEALAKPPLDPLIIPAAGLVVLVALVVAAGSLVGRFRRARGRPSASSCAGWPGGRRWPRWRWWSPSPSWRGTATRPCSRRRSVSVWPYCR